MLLVGLIHGRVLGRGPTKFKDHFDLLKGRLVDPRASIKGAIITRSAVGLVAVYNLFPEKYRGEKNVINFQRLLQETLKQRAQEGCTDWKSTFYPRAPIPMHPLNAA